MVTDTGTEASVVSSTERFTTVSTSRTKSRLTSKSSVPVSDTVPVAGAIDNAAVSLSSTTIVSDPLPKSLVAKTLTVTSDRSILSSTAATVNVSRVEPAGIVTVAGVVNNELSDAIVTTVSVADAVDRSKMPVRV